MPKKIGDIVEVQVPLVICGIYGLGDNVYYLCRTPGQPGVAEYVTDGFFAVPELYGKNPAETKPLPPSVLGRAAELIAELKGDATDDSDD